MYPRGGSGVADGGVRAHRAVPALGPVACGSGSIENAKMGRAELSQTALVEDPLHEALHRRHVVRCRA